jgi:hypothetical protein
MPCPELSDEDVERLARKFAVQAANDLSGEDYCGYVDEETKNIEG